MLFRIFIVYFMIISVTAVAMTIYDKVAAKKGKWRISEKTLILVSVFGGSICMLATMLLIRHKTRKLKFMIGIPVIILLQLVAALLLVRI